jgi:hypothetical protein
MELLLSLQFTALQRKCNDDQLSADATAILDCAESAYPSITNLRNALFPSTSSSSSTTNIEKLSSSSSSSSSSELKQRIPLPLHIASNLSTSSQRVSLPRGIPSTKLDSSISACRKPYHFFFLSMFLCFFFILYYNTQTSSPLSLHSSTQAFWKTCEERAIFELYSNELITHLFQYLKERVKHYNNNKGEREDLVVLEVGAGNGKLTAALKKKFEEDASTASSSSSPRLVFHATDIRPPKTTTTVKRMNSRRAITKYKPSFVICAWMPSGVDLTSDMRQSTFTTEYILIGPPNTSNSGDAWATWGISSPELVENYGLDPNAKPPYVEDNWCRYDLDLLSSFCCGRFDVDSSHPFSKVVSFRRMQKKNRSLWEMSVEELCEMVAKF